MLSFLFNISLNFEFYKTRSDLVKVWNLQKDFLLECEHVFSKRTYLKWVFIGICFFEKELNEVSTMVVVICLEVDTSIYVSLDE